MGFRDAVRRGIRIVKLERAAYREVAADPQALTQALVIAGLAGIASWLAPPSFRLGGVILGPLGALLGLFVMAGVLHFAAVLFGGRGDYLTLVRVWGTGWIVSWALIVPWLGMVVSLWGLVVACVALEELYGLDRPRAVIAVLIPVAAAALLGLILIINLALFGGLRGWFSLV